MIPEQRVTGGLASTSQLQVTGAALARIDTGMMLVMPILEMVFERTVPVQMVVQEHSQEDADPAEAVFVGPLGTPRSHEERAQSLKLNYRRASNDVYLEVPDDIL